MAKINLSDEILKHDDDEIIEFLYSKMRDIKRSYQGAFEQNNPSIVYTSCSDVELVDDILRKLDRRNKEKAL